MNKNLNSWESNMEILKIFSLNCQSIQKKITHIKEDSVVLRSDVICLSETWLRTDIVSEDLKIEGFDLALNSSGAGKGLGTYFRGNILQLAENINEEKFQLTKLCSENLDVISVYRSQHCKKNDIEVSLIRLINSEKRTVICGDFNICFEKEKHNGLIKTIERHGFKQFVDDATHISGGHIDHVYSNNNTDIEVTLYSPYYCAKDHDGLLIEVQKDTNMK